VITPGQFQQDFPEFANRSTTNVQFWLTKAYSQLNAFSLGLQLDFAAELYAAHFLTLQFAAQQTSQNGGGGGQSAGMTASKAVGGASIAYDTGSTAIEGAGMWNATFYGQTLYPILRGASAGPIYDPGPDPFFEGRRLGGPRTLGF
jgi:Protein of unknown function (DUF4054)